MIVVTQGKVDGKPAGSVIDNLSAEQESRLVALGVAAYCDDNHEDDARGNDLTVKELKELCKQLGLPTSGKKVELEERIAQYEADNAGDEDDDDDPDGEGGDDHDSSDDGDDEPPALSAEVAQ